MVKNLFNWNYHSISGKKLPILLLFLFGLVLHSTRSFAQEDDIFWFAAPNITEGHWWYDGGTSTAPGAEPIYFRIANANSLKSTEVRITQPRLNPSGLGIDTTIFLGPDEFSTVDLSPYKNFIENNDYNKVVNKGLKIESSKTDITVYYSENQHFNMDLFSLKGKNGFGDHFFVPFQNQMYNDSAGYTPPPHSTINLVLTGEKPKLTEVWVYPTNPIEGHAGQDSFKVVLEHPGETYSLRAKYYSADKHLGGTEIKVKSGNDIAVTIADDSDARGGCRDLNGDQITPVNVVGYDYVVVGGSLTGHDNGDDIYIVPTEDGTQIDLDGDGTYDITRNAGDVHYEDMDPNTTRYISGSKPMYVYHVTGINNCEIGGAQIPTIDGCTGSAEVSFYRSNDKPFYLTILAKDIYKDYFWMKYSATDSVKIDTSFFKPVPNNPDWVYLSEQTELFESTDPNIIGVAPNSVATVENHHPQGVFHLGVVNTTSATGNHGSKYGYFSSFIQDTASAEIATTNTQISKYYCEGDTVFLKASGGRTESSYYWYAENPSYDKYLTTRNFKTCEVIGLPADTSYYTFKVIVYPPCEPIDTLTMKVLVNPVPNANFEIIDTTTGLPISRVQCAPFNANIKNTTTKAKRYTWYWDYADYPSSNYDTIDTKQFVRTFNNTTYEDSTYTIRLLAQGEVCTDEHISEVMVHPEIHADYDIDRDTICNFSDVFFTNLSSGDTSLFDWDFGDQITSLDTLTLDHLHTYSHNYTFDTTYSTRLIATSPKNCKDTAYHDITVRSFLEADFSIDTVKGCSPFPVRITNNAKGDVDAIHWELDGDNLYDDSTQTVNTTKGNFLYYYYNTGKTTIDTIDIGMIVSNGHCYDTARRTVYVYPEVTADYTPGDLSGCNPQLVDFTNQSHYTGMTTSDTTGLVYDWDFGDEGTSHLYNPDHLFDNINPSDTTYQVKLMVTSPHGCQDSTSSQITVSPYIKADFKVQETNGCSPFEVRFENTSEGGIDSTYWDFDEDDNTDSTLTDTYFTKTFHNDGTVPDTVRLRQVVVNEDHCRDTVFRQIIIYPAVTAAFQPLDTLECNPVEVNFRNNSEYTGTGVTTGLTYDWDFGDGSTSSLFEPTYLFAHTGDTTANFPVSLTVTNPFGCADTLVDQVQVHPFVEAGFSISTGSGCSPLEVEVTNNSSGGTYHWYWDDSSMATPDQTTNSNGILSNTYHNTDGTIDTLQLTLVATNGVNCYDTMKRQVVVYPEVTADFTPRDAIDCNPHEVTFDNLSAYSNTGDNSGLTWQWDFGDGLSTKDFEPVHSFLHTGDTTATFNTTLQAISPYNCRDTITQPVRVQPFIQADFEIDVNKGCSPLDVTITNNSTGGITDYYWFWDSDNLALASADSSITDVSFAKTYYNNSEAPRVDTLTLIVTNGNCYDTLKRAVTVYSSINAGFTPDRVEGCNPLEVNFTNNTTHAGSFSWEFGDGSTSNKEDPVNIFENPATRDTTFRVQFVATSPYGCTDTAWRDITVYSKLQADFEVPQNEGCPPFPVTFENTSVGNTNNTYQWSIDGSPESSAPSDASDFSHVFTNEDPTLREYGIELRAENSQGCVSTYRDTITVYHDVDSDFAMDRVEGCSPLQVDFTSSASVPANTTYNWNFGDGATSSNPNPIHTFANYDRVNDTSFTISLEVISPYNCAHDTSKTITVYHQPRARFDIDTTSSCPPLLTTMENQSVGHFSFEWRFGDGNTNTTDDVVQDYSYGGNNTNDVKSYNLELYVESDRGCGDSTGLVLNVYPEVVADFEMDNAADCHPHPVVFTERSQNADFFQWDFDDGATSSQEDPIHRFVNVSDADTTYDVQLIASSAFNCADTITQPVEVFAQPNARFNVTPLLQKWPEQRVWITNIVKPGPWEYNWNFGDGNTHSTDEPYNGQPHDYDIWGSYNIYLEVQSTTSYCQDTVSKNVQIQPPRTYASFTMDDPDGCEPHEVQFTGGESPFVDQTNETYEYEWDFGDGSSGSGRFPTHVYDSAGVYYVSMKATGAGDEEDVATDTVVVYKVPEVDFDVDPKLVMLPDQVMHCYNFTNYATTYKWNFGDGNTSDKKNPEHVYEELGIYDIVLTASKKYPNDHVCRDSLRKEDMVNVEGKGFIRFPDAFTPDKNGPSDGYWDPQDQSNDIFHPVGEGVVEYTLEIFNKWGERLFISEDFRIGWDGYFEGELMPQDVYIYKAEGKYSNGKTFEKMGNVTLLR